MGSTISLNDFMFSLGPKNQIEYRTARSIAKLEVPGLAPKYQDMGEDEHIIEWNGVFDGDSAWEECKKVEAIKAAGKEITLSVGANGAATNKTVRIKEFNYSVVRDDHITYSIILYEIQPETKVDKVVLQAVSTGNGANAGSPTVNKTVTYTVKKGDTLYAIAQKYLGKGNRWGEIAKANNIKDPRKLQIGTVLKINVQGGA